MVVELDAHQTSLEPFGLPWSSYHVRHPDDGPSLGNSSRSHYFKASTSAPNSPPSVFRVLKAGSSSSNGGGNGNSNNSHSSAQNLSRCRIDTSGPRFARIQVQLQPCRPRPSTLSSPTAGRPRPKKANSAPVVLQSQPKIGGGDNGEHLYDGIYIAKVDSTRSLTFPALAPGTATHGEGEKGAAVFSFPREVFAPSSALTPRAAKRRRALHDVDGPGTGGLPCKKRRLLLHLVTSRLSLPYSWPATHILNRESGDDSPVLSRFLKFAAMGSLKKAGHQSALFRKAAILNRVRIGVRQAAVLRGHTVIAGMAARGNSLSHGLQLATTSNCLTGARFPGQTPNPYDHPMPSAWQPHTTSFHTLSFSSNPPVGGISTATVSKVENIPSSPMTTMPPLSTPPQPSPPAKLPNPPAQLEEEEDGAAFPSQDLESRYADFSDDDLDDVYADFGVIFGSGARSSEGSSGGSEATSGEHFYEEYLDELDGIRWIA